MKRIRIVAGLVVLTAIGAGLWFWRGRDPAEARDRLVLSGNVDIRQVQLAFNNSERIAAVLVQEGDRVQAGQLLATLDTRRLEARAASRAGQVAAQHQVVARLEAGNRPEEIRKAKADVAAAQADLQNTRLTYARVTNLVAQTVDTPQRLDDARAALDVATARLAAANEAYRLMVLGPRQEDLAAARATLQVSEADRALAQRELADAQLYAPTNGVIQNRLLEPGDMASPQKPVFTLALDDPLWVRAYVSETDLGKIRPGQPAQVTTDSFPGKRYDAWIGFVSPTAEFSPKTVETAEVRTKLVYQVRAFVRNPRGELRLGMPAIVIVQLHPPAGSDRAAEASGTGAK